MTIPAPITGTGELCNGCRKTESACARLGPCCRQCSHTFGEEPPGVTTRPAVALSPPPALSHSLSTIVTGTTRPLLEQAADIDHPKVNRLADKAHQALQDLKTAIEEYRGQAAAREKIARLKTELAAAKAALRGQTSTTRQGGGSPKAASTGPVADEALECRKGCGTTSKNAAGRSAHERHCKGAA